ncbi:hypothetical protein [Chitinophaga nivalis]|uniref:Outer membrane protein beta-barrel domain-containing protein n=1 Tax=Chitinophaga nivalis TaxID=2991709 RepID=A0ABT3IFH7_9BACT|nr:hypothetical protein [Chitinophaga nivalis]MCW3467594.1 hypothetical protein [Chitinophaga nivalis]MCW3482714.1 hypothetical protein [Chitinophaga nivalis]
MNTRCKLYAGLLFIAGLFGNYPVKAQHGKGFQSFNRYGAGVQKSAYIDVGWLAYSYTPSRHKGRYYDISAGTEAIISKYFLVAPKLSMDAAIMPVFGGKSFYPGFGMDFSVPTNFRECDYLLTPKAGIALAYGLLRLYYGYNFVIGKQHFTQVGAHKISFEVNLSSLQGEKLQIVH